MKFILKFLNLTFSKVKHNIGKIGLLCLTSSILIPLAINFGLSLGYKIPTHFMLGQLNLSQFYPLFNTVIVLCSILIIANIKGISIKPRQLYIGVFFALLLPFFILLFGGEYKQTYEAIHYLFAHFPLVWSECKYL